MDLSFFTRRHKQPLTIAKASSFQQSRSEIRSKIQSKPFTSANACPGFVFNMLATSLLSLSIPSHQALEAMTSSQTSFAERPLARMPVRSTVTAHAAVAGWPVLETRLHVPHQYRPHARPIAHAPPNDRLFGQRMEDGGYLKFVMIRIWLAGRTASACEGDHGDIARKCLKPWLWAEHSLL
jgi:hypothetical protein